jgi:hypothetical protein
LFFNKKNETDRSHPHDILALYEATDLKKESPHSFAFKIGTHSHTFKATSDAERDGWYLSIEKAIEIGKASKDEILASEGYTAEHEKLSTYSYGACRDVYNADFYIRQAICSRCRRSVQAPAKEEHRR